MLREQSRALHHSPAAHRCWGSRKCHSCHPQSLIYEPRLPSSKRLPFLLTKAAARPARRCLGTAAPTGSTPGTLARSIPPAGVPPAPRCSQCPRALLWLCAASQTHGLAMVGAQTDPPHHPPASGTLPLPLTPLPAVRTSPDFCSYQVIYYLLH